MTEVSTLTMEDLKQMQQAFAEKAQQFLENENKWRSRTFKVALMLGVLPVLAGVTQLFPENLRPLCALTISIGNVFVVVVNVKLDMGERIADASMAYKGYKRLASDFELYLFQMKCAEEKPNPSKLLDEVRLMLSILEANISYPEVLPEKKTAKVKPTDLPLSSERSLSIEQSRDASIDRLEAGDGRGRYPQELPHITHAQSAKSGNGHAPMTSPQSSSTQVLPDMGTASVVPTLPASSSPKAGDVCGKADDEAENSKELS